ncbi:uncharacterized protein VTP21DRAFT_7295 [Calcarisporiella thermophila]|uniref:uncharacterized protein n=1 Tax=Calcarisporiella thermophila TaxID=911321 RepID=UPI003742CD1B
MARNQEKAQSMLYRFREAQAAELGFKKRPDKRPTNTLSISSLTEAEMWRHDTIREISRKVSRIQDIGLPEYQIRDLNDEINKLMREKYRWEMRIKDLGGPDYRRVGPRMLDHEGKEVPGIRGYRYFGRARDLPGVRELFEQHAPEEEGKDRSEMYKNIDADYYGYRDEEDGMVLEYEKEQEARAFARALGQIQNQTQTSESQKLDHKGSKQLNYMEETEFIAHVPVPTQKEVEEFLVRRRQQMLLDRYVVEEAK